MEKRKSIHLLFKRIEALLLRYETGIPVMPPTELYNEGWMLRHSFRFASIDLRNKSHPLAVPPDVIGIQRRYFHQLLSSRVRGGILVLNRELMRMAS